MNTLPTRDQVPEIVRGPRMMASGPGAGGRGPGGPGGGPGGGPEGSGFTGKDVLRVIRKRLWMILIIALAVITVTFGGTMAWYVYAPMYTAEANLLVTPPQTRAFSVGTGLAPKDQMERLLQSHAQLAHSQAVIKKALGDAAVTGTQWFSEHRGPRIERTLQEAISVSPVTNTSYIQVSMTSTAKTKEQRGELADIVNAVSKAVEEVHRSGLSKERQEDIDRLDAQKKTLEADLARVQDQARMARESTDIPNLQKQRTVLDIRLNSLTQELQNLRILRAQAEADLEALREQEAAGQLAYAPEVVQALESDPTLQQLRNNAMNLQLQLEGLRERVGPGHRSIKSVETRLSGIRNQVVSREEELTARAIELLRSSRAARVTSLTNTILSVQGQWAEVSAQVRDLEAALTRLEQLATTEENLEGRIDKIEDQLLELRVLAEGERQVELAIPAHVPQRISQPKFAMMIPLGVVLGLGLGFGLAFLLEFVDTSVKSPSDVSRRVNLPLLGMVPHEHDLDEDVDDMRLVWQSHPHSLVGEAFRQIRTCLLFSGPASQRRSLLVTSPMPEDGRTTVALNLAAAIANGGRRVLVVDANFRQPAIQELFPEAPDAGLSNALVGQGDWRESVREVQPNYFVLPAGVMPPNPAELLGSDEMRRLLGEMTDEYDQVLIDGAPCLVVTDPSVLATLVDGVVLTVRAGANTYGIVQRTRDMLLRVGAHVTGVALNGVRATSGGYLRKNYETFYEYHEQPRLAAHRE